MYRKPFKPPRPLLLLLSLALPLILALLRSLGPLSLGPPSMGLLVGRAMISRSSVNNNKRIPEILESNKLKIAKLQPGTKEYIVQWRKKTAKKNKTWDGDGLITFNGSTITFKCDFSGNEKYRVVGSIPRRSIEGTISIGAYELEVDCEVEDTNKENVKVEQKASPLKSVSPPVVQFKKVAPAPSGKPVIKPVPELFALDSTSLVMKKPKDATVDVIVDPILSSALRPHQREGVAFLYECVMGLRPFKGNGALLADEMGLGKTLMTISLIYTLLRQSPDSTGGVCKKVLICCPVTLIGNWKKEFRKWLGTHKVSVLAINNKQSTAKDKQDIKNFGKTRVYNVMILSYEKLLSCQDILKDIKFDLLVCDEGHRLKNSANKCVKVINEYLNIKRRVLLTGTPMQNDLIEFYNICHFINPGILGNFASFQKEFLKPIQRLREVNCINRDTIRRGEAKSKELVELTKGFTLRRTSGILSKYLTPKTDLVLFCPPTAKQISLFKFISNTHKFKRLILTSTSNDSLLMINLFKKICNSPSLLNQDKTFQAITEELKEFKSNMLDKSSGKILTLIPLLIEIKKTEEKTVIISNYTQTLNLLQEILKKLNILFLRLDGSTPNTMRDKLVVEFNTLPVTANSVFLLSAKSGGVGLNLIGASRLVLFDNDWNPAVDLQAMARIHRDGQKRPVFIYRLMTTGCIDEKIFQRQLMKNSLSDKFVDNKNGSNSDVFDMDDLKDLFTINLETKSNTHDLLECSCEGVGEDLLLETSTQDDEPREEDEDEDETPPGWISALDFKQIDQKEIKKKASIRSALLEYNHYQPKNYDIECGDELIYKLLKTSTNSPISYILSKYTTNNIDTQESSKD